MGRSGRGAGAGAAPGGPDGIGTGGAPGARAGAETGGASWGATAGPEPGRFGATAGAGCGSEAIAGAGGASWVRRPGPEPGAPRSPKAPRPRERRSRHGGGACGRRSLLGSDGRRRNRGRLGAGAAWGASFPDSSAACATGPKARRPAISRMGIAWDSPESSDFVRQRILLTLPEDVHRHLFLVLQVLEDRVELLGGETSSPFTCWRTSPPWNPSCSKVVPGRMAAIR